MSDADHTSLAPASEPAVPNEPEQVRRTLDAVAGQLEWVQERLDELDAAASAAASALANPAGSSPSS